jgi:hypothetical protein
MIHTTPAVLRSAPWSILLAGVALMGSGSFVQADFNFDDFSDVSGLQLNGSAAQVGNVLRLTPAAFSQGGSAFTTTPIALGDENTFSTYFQFQITGGDGGIGDEDGVGADGIVFVVQTVSNTVGGAGGGIGYLGISPSLGIEFDTYNNGLGAGDPNGNHAGINLNGSIASIVAVVEATRFNNEQVWNAWIEYDGPSDSLEVRWSTTNLRPAAAQASATVDLPALLGQDTAFIGFTSGTGSGYGNHDILRWTYRESGEPIPEPSSLLLLVFGCGALAVRTRR